MTTWFLFFTFGMPRTTLFLYYFFLEIPHNETPFALDLIGAIFAPHLLVAYWLYEANYHPLLVVLFVIRWFIGLFSAKSAKIKVSNE